MPLSVAGRLLRYTVGGPSEMRRHLADDGHNGAMQSVGHACNLCRSTLQLCCMSNTPAALVTRLVVERSTGDSKIRRAMHDRNSALCAST